MGRSRSWATTLTLLVACLSLQCQTGDAICEQTNFSLSGLASSYIVGQQASVNVSTSPPVPGSTLSYLINESGGGSATFQAGSTSTTTDSSGRAHFTVSFIGVGNVSINVASCNGALSAIVTILPVPAMSTASAATSSPTSSSTVPATTSATPTSSATHSSTNQSDYRLRPAADNPCSRGV
ncbi:hypothetical protein WJX75_002940 [Coccomyxa subellipsoidea]|uniref:Big-1 domain-containing protein n=1 Tax=Coccomyxa subellipsoidea TaxID=248742 RepID=A0ABR2YDQ3_9CHLO